VWLVLGLMVLEVIMVFVWAYTFLSSPGVVNQTVSPWPPVVQVAWVATCGLMALVGLCAACIPGLVLLARPAVRTHLTGRALLARRADWRRWQLSSLALAWSGIGLVGFALAMLLTSWDPALGPSRVEIGPLVIMFAVTFMPRFVVRLAAWLVPHAPR
jgi:hypothetical protein